MHDEIPHPEEIEDSDDVAKLIAAVRTKNVEHIELVDGAVLIRFTVGDWDDAEEYRLEVNIHGGNLWLHHESDDGTETIWENKRRHWE